ncbi:hypothetical protein QYE76_036574 [Lolium multiflorum]|uniref:Uncharacterized protein n=1 Tax=Lolium multiflorum TaxID=4521 RepID=A0AAD8R210_LOLMU|nr:hypothetical protein QYE76_036574 [Lolium multiflorum]
MAAEDLGNLEWERSKISQQDINMLKKLGISGKQDSLRLEESYPTPPMQYRVSFVDHLIRGVSTPIHDFLRGLLFMTMRLRRLFLPFPKVGKSKKGLLSPTTTRVRLALRVKPQVLENLRHPLKRTRGRGNFLDTLSSFTASPRSKRKRDEELIPAPPKPLPVPRNCTDAGKRALILTKLLLSLPFMKELIHFGTQFIGYREYAAKLEENLAESNKHADALATKLEQSEKARKKAEADAATVEDLRKRLHQAETSLSDNLTQQSAREKEIITRLESQSRRFGERNKTMNWRVLKVILF